ncbi:F-box only protein 39-like [Microplitis demolitor]|uniref:F-box only protein 39-like n=1 Tax=Microplitis demolitor TaxID=69319 RepID=UPI0004CD91C0|nr:F-box only protein 39-like [Microplitis demolitor]
MWDQLPELILTLIFDHLECRDRFNVDRTCQSWSRALAAPVLWRSITITIDRDLRGDLSPTKQLVAKYGQYIRKLEFAWSRPYILPRETRATWNIRAKEGIEFIGVIKDKTVQLNQLVLTNWFFGTNWNHRSKLLYAVGHFLRCQQKLNFLSLLNANLGVSDVLRLFRAVSWSCGGTLEQLDIRGAFKDWQAPHSNSRYLEYLGRLHTLTTFKLDYPALSDLALNSLATAAPKVLRDLHISVRDSDSRQHTIQDEAWLNLVTVCPQLTVSYTIVNISHYEDIAYLLLPSIPLARFHMYGGHVWDQSRSRNFRSTVGLLITYYTKTLTEVTLQLRNNREALDDLLVSMLERCKRLMKLQYDGIIRNVDTLREIFGLQVDNKTYFQTIHVKPRNLSLKNRLILDDINYRYGHKLMDRGVDFRIDDPAFNFY